MLRLLSDEGGWMQWNLYWVGNVPQVSDEAFDRRVPSHLVGLSGRASSRLAKQSDTWKCKRMFKAKRSRYLDLFGGHQRQLTVRLISMFCGKGSRLSRLSSVIYVAFWWMCFSIGALQRTLACLPWRLVGSEASSTFRSSAAA